MNTPRDSFGGGGGGGFTPPSFVTPTKSGNNDSFATPSGVAASSTAAAAAAMMVGGQLPRASTGSLLARGSTGSNANSQAINNNTSTGFVPPPNSPPLFAPGSPAALRSPTLNSSGHHHMLILPGSSGNNNSNLRGSGVAVVNSGGGYSNSNNNNRGSSTTPQRNSAAGGGGGGSSSAAMRRSSGEAADRFIPPSSGTRGLEATRFQLFSGTPRTYQRGSTRSKSPDDNERCDEPYARLLARSLLCGNGEDDANQMMVNTSNNNNNNGSSVNNSTNSLNLQQLNIVGSPASAASANSSTASPISQHHHQQQQQQQLLSTNNAFFNNGVVAVDFIDSENNGPPPQRSIFAGQRLSFGAPNSAAEFFGTAGSFSQTAPGAAAAAAATTATTAPSQNSASGRSSFQQPHHARTSSGSLPPLFRPSFGGVSSQAALGRMSAASTGSNSVNSSLNGTTTSNGGGAANDTNNDDDDYLLGIGNDGDSNGAAAAASLGPHGGGAEGERFSWTLSSVYNANRARNFKSRAFRIIPQTPERILDAPDLLDDFYLHLLDWGSQNILAVALSHTLYLWNADTGDITQLMSTSTDRDDYITSVAWHPEGQHLAVGLHSSEVQLWDTRAQQCIKTFTGHTGRVGSLAWNSSLLATGGRDATIRIHDTRASSAVNAIHRGHAQEVCGLDWSPCGRRLASGGNDNVVNVWDFPMRHSSVEDGHPLLQIRRHVAAVKALAWNPVKRGLLATGGGTADKTLCFWDTNAPVASSSLARDGAAAGNTNNNGSNNNGQQNNLNSVHNLASPLRDITGGVGVGGTQVSQFTVVQTTPLHCVDTQSQICGVLWNRDGTELVTSHGYSNFELAVWKYPSLRRIADLTGHGQRVLHLSMSPDGETVVSAAADETIRFWKIYQQQQQQMPAGSTDTSGTTTGSGSTPGGAAAGRSPAGGRKSTSRRGDVSAEDLDLATMNQSDAADWDLSLR